jgi:hypothetical protein
MRFRETFMSYRELTKTVKHVSSFMLTVNLLESGLVSFCANTQTLILSYKIESSHSLQLIFTKKEYKLFSMALKL